MSTDEDRDLAYGMKGLAWLGVLPLILVAAALLILSEGPWREQLVEAAIAYAAVVLAFIGAVHWGLILARNNEGAARRLAMAVLPALVGAGAWFLPPTAALAVLVAGFGGWWMYEHRVLGPMFLPLSYLRLRRELTLVVCVTLAVILMAYAP